MAGATKIDLLLSVLKSIKKSNNAIIVPSSLQYFKL